ncbi:MAG TPA: protein kinase [Albitalea sp.]
MAAADPAFPLDRSGARASRNRESLAAGTRLDDFEILRTIGSGGFGTVYLAHDRALDRQVAIKEYLPAQLAFRARGLQVAVRAPELAASYVAGLKSFVNEAQILARFSHPAVVKVHRFWEANGTAYMVMPYVRGPTLRELRRSMKASPTEAWLRSVLDPLLDALAKLHAEGIYHRDIAPDNVLLPTLREPVLLDFGAARRVIGDRSQTFTAVLKPSFAPIEQYAEANALRQGPWTDLYALGAVIVYMLKAMPPPPSTVRAVHDEMTPLTHCPPPDVSATFLSAVQWALAVRPQERPQSVQAFCDALNGHIVAPAARSLPLLATTLDVQGKAPVMVQGESATWDTTIRLGGGAPALPAPARRAAARTRSLAMAATASFAITCGAALALLRDLRTEPSADTWRTLAQQAVLPVADDEIDAAPQPETRLVATAAEDVEGPPVLQKVAATKTADAVALLAPVAPMSPMAPRLTPVKQAEVRAPSRSAKPSAATRNHKPTAPRARPGPSPREVCGDRNFFSMGICINRRCEEPRFAKHAQCQKLREQREERRRRDY